MIRLHHIQDLQGDGDFRSSHWSMEIKGLHVGEFIHEYPLCENGAITFEQSLRRFAVTVARQKGRQVSAEDISIAPQQVDMQEYAKKLFMPQL